MRRLNIFASFLFIFPMIAFGQTGNTSYGSNALSNNTTGSSNSAFGYNVLFTNTTGSNNSAFGSYALYNNTGLYYTGSYNSAFGSYALYYNTTGSNNCAFGSYALNNNTTGNSNFALGYSALSNNSTGYWNTAIGNVALNSNTFGYYNTAIGGAALWTNKVGNWNTAIGNDALYWNEKSYNTAVGTDALYYNTNGENNTAIGHFAMRNNDTGSFNTAIGFEAGYDPNNYIINWNNTTAIGNGSIISQSNEVVLGNTSITRFVVGTSVTIISDRRTKRNIRAEVPGLAFINLLQPVTYNLDLDAIDEIRKSDDPEINRRRDSLRMARSPEAKEIEAKSRANKEKQVYSGFIAQDVEKAAQSVGYDFSGVDAPENDKSPYGLRYAEFVVPLVKAVQELSEQNSKLQEQINELIAKINDLTNTPRSSNEGVIDEGGASKTVSFSIFPNPANGFVTIDYSLYVDAQISIELYNMFGQRLKLIVPQQNKKAGTYSVQISIGDLGDGTYIVKATSGNQIVSKQLTVNH